MALNLRAPKVNILKPKISIFGVGGAGGNAINNMIRSNLEGVEFIAANTDSQSLANSLAEYKIQLGVDTTKGLGAGSFPDQGRAAAEENLAEIEKYLEGNNMIFIAAGMGGGTGTGAAPVIAKLARERDILTVGVVTKPFSFEGKYRMDIAEAGIEELKKYVDTLIIIPNQNLFRIANENTTFESAFKMADDVLHAGVRGITDLITMPGLVNLDFADIRTIMTKMGKAMMGTGEAEGENRAIIACEAAISNPLLDDVSIRGAKGVLVNMTGGPDMTLFEADAAVNAIKKEVDSNANIIFGSAFNAEMKGKIRISVVATGIDEDDFRGKILNKKEEVEKKVPNLFAEKEEKVEEKNIFNTKFGKAYFDAGNIVPIKEDGIQEADKIDFHAAKDVHVKEEFAEEVKIAHPESAPSKESKPIADFTQISFFQENSLEEKLQETQEDSLAQERSLAQESVEAVKKKESSPFGLFSFMNSAKKKAKTKQDEDGAGFSRQEAWANEDTTPLFKASKLRDEEESSKSTNQIFNEIKNSEDSSSEDRDNIDIPAFFRRNK